MPLGFEILFSFCFKISACGFPGGKFASFMQNHENIGNAGLEKNTGLYEPALSHRNC